MLSLRKPSAESIRRFLLEQAKLDFTYSAVGATGGTPPAGYVIDHTRIKLGEGEQVYNYVADLNVPRRLELIGDALSARGHTSARIEKILGGNWMRVFGAAWG